MFNQATLPNDVLVNPLAIQSIAIEELEQRLLGGEKIVDANSPFMFLMEMTSSGIADAINSVHNNLQSLYPSRAQTVEDLYKHMSTWDYVNLFSTPTSTTIRLTFDRDYIIDNAVDVLDTNGNIIPDYKKIMIQSDSVINIAEYTFGLYYPIEIRVKKLVGSDPSILVLYNTDIVNPLHPLESNLIDHNINDYQGVKLLSFDIPIYQFSKRTITEDILSTNGFTKKYIHLDKFYAVRLYSYGGVDSNNQPIWNEMSQTLSNDIYDPATLTARVEINSDDSTIKVVIPQVYFTNNLMGSKLKLDILTTKGMLDIDIIGIAPEAIVGDFISNPDDPNYRYSQVLSRIPTIDLTPVSTKIQGGSDGYGIEELRQRVLSNTFYNDVLISNSDLTKFYKDVGFDIVKYQDGITDRVYYAYKEVTDRYSNIIGIADIPTEITNDIILNCDTIIDSLYDQSITILPETLFRYNGSLATPVLNDELAIINTMSKSEKVVKYNNDNLTNTIYHTRVNMDDNYAMSFSYNLVDPKIINMNFINENKYTASQITISTSTISQNVNNNGYVIDFTVKLSDDLKDKSISQIKAMARTVSAAAESIWIEPTLIIDNMTNGTITYRINILTSFVINQTHDLRWTNWSNMSGTSLSHFVALDTVLDMVFFVDDILVPTIDPAIPGPIPANYNNMNAVSYQSLSVKLGYRVEELYNGTDIVFSELKYNTYNVTTYKKYDTDIYLRDANGVVVNNVVNGVLELTILHKLGDWVFKETIDGTESVVTHLANSVDTTHIDIVDASVVIIGQGVSGNNITPGTLVIGKVNNTIELDSPILNTIVDEDIIIGTLVVQHDASDPILDIHGKPTVSENRTVLYHVDMIHIDAKLGISDMLEQANYLSYVLSDLSSYLNTIHTTKQQLIENTDLYFKPVRTLGVGRFRLSEQTEISIDLNISVRFRYYVNSQVLLDTQLLDAIRNTTLSIIDNHVKKDAFSCSAIVEDIKLQVGPDIRHIDILGINDDINLQTLIAIDKNTKPSLSQVLSLDQLGNIQLTRALYIDYVTI